MVYPDIRDIYLEYRAKIILLAEEGNTVPEIRQMINIDDKPKKLDT